MHGGGGGEAPPEKMIVLCESRPLWTHHFNQETITKSYEYVPDLFKDHISNKTQPAGHACRMSCSVGAGRTYFLVGACLCDCARVDARQDVRGTGPTLVTRSISRFVNLSSVELMITRSGLSAFSSNARCSPPLACRACHCTNH